MLRQIRRALARIEDGSYGVCLHCEEDISPKRVNAVPWAAFCIKCQEQVDRHEIEVDDTADLFASAAMGEPAETIRSIKLIMPVVGPTLRSHT